MKRCKGGRVGSKTMHQTERNILLSLKFSSLQVNKLIMFEGRIYEIYNPLPGTTVLMCFSYFVRERGASVGTEK